MRSMKSRSRQRGFSLAEVMVATAILVIVLVGILTLYDRANRVFKSGNESAEMQQNVRIAYDRMVSDIRMAGFDFKRGGPLLPGQSAAAWSPARPYSAGTIVVPTTPNGSTYRATNAGTSGPTEPTWPTATGATVVETGATPPITWQENGGAVYEQPDEQIEYTGATALTVRANFDYSVNPMADDHGTETNYESAQFPIVTTGNDEIVTYALVSSRAPAGTAPNNQSVSMYVDMNSGACTVPDSVTRCRRRAFPGGAAESLKTITGVDLTNANPPYTLYRFTFDDSGNVVRTPLADNIRSLNFFYFQDPAGQQPLTDAAGAFAPNVGGGGQYDPAVAGSVNAPDRLVRKKIRAIRVRLVGMNANPDANYTDTSTANGQFGSSDTAGFPQFVTDTIAPTYRRLTVDTLVVPRNLGMTGMPQTFLSPPPAPSLTNVCIGYCGIAVVNWNPNTPNPDETFTVSWDIDPLGSFSHSFNAGTSNTFAIDLTQEDLTQTFYFKVSASNSGGTVSSTNTLSASARNATVPNPPSLLTASGGGGIPPISGKIRVAWTAPVTIASGAPSCTPSGSPAVSNYLREIKGFRVYRSTDPNFSPGLSNRILDENATGPTAPQTDGYGNYTWDDTTVACGTTYYYRIRTVEWCFANAAFNVSNNANDSLSAYYPSANPDPVSGQSGTTGTPGVPVNLQVAPLAPASPPTGMSNSVCNSGMNVCTPINLMWSKVTLDTGGNPVSIDSYDIERTQLLNGVPTAAPCSGCSGGTANPAIINMTGALGMSGSNVTFADTEPEHDPVTLMNYTYNYRVRAVQTAPCPTGNWSAVVTFPPPCTFTGSIIVETGASAGDGLTPATAWVMNGGDTIQVQPPLGTTLVNTVMQIVDPGGNVVATNTSNTSPANFTWVNLTPGTPYTCTFTMTNNAAPPCTQQLVRYIQQEPLPACALTTFANQNSILAQTSTNYQLKLSLINSAAEALTLTEIDFNWTQPNRITWNSVQFPSGAAVAGPGTASGNYNVILSPRPGTVTVGDVTVGANATQAILLNFARTIGNPPNVTPALMNSICVKYTRPSQGAFVFNCRILPDASSNNPNTCQ